PNLLKFPIRFSDGLQFLNLKKCRSSGAFITRIPVSTKMSLLWSFYRDENGFLQRGQSYGVCSHSNRTAVKLKLISPPFPDPSSWTGCSGPEPRRPYRHDNSLPTGSTCPENRHLLCGRLHGQRTAGSRFPDYGPVK